MAKLVAPLIGAALLVIAAVLAPEVAGDQFTRDATATQPRAIPSPKAIDSAAVRILEYDLMSPPSPTDSRFFDPFSYTLRGVGAAFVISRVPFATIGGQRENPSEELDPAHPFINSLLLSSGTIVVTDRTHLKFFRPDGALVRAVGRPGRGPMEFTQIREMCRLRGDSLLVFDYAGGSSIWDSTGNFVRAYSRPTGRRVPGSCDEFGNFVTQEATTKLRPPAVDEGDVMYASRIVRPNGTVLRDLGQLPGPEQRALVSRSPSIIPTGKSLLVCGARNYELRWQGLEGRTQRIVRFRRRPLEISEKESRARVMRSVPRNVEGSDRSELVSNLLAKGLPKRWPAYSIVRVDAAGRVWVSDYESEASWTVFDSLGSLLGRVDLSEGRPFEGVRLVEVGRDFIAVARRDSDGAIQIAYHRISGADARSARGRTSRSSAQF